MIETRRFTEAATAVNNSGKWRVLALAEGISKNGVMYGDAIADQITEALPAGSRMMVNHDSEAPFTGGDVAKVAGKTLANLERIPGEGWYTDVQIADKWQAFVEDFKDQIGVSINIKGSAEERDGYREAVLMEADAYNSLDLVVAPGAGGKFTERLQEAYNKASQGEYLRENDTAPVAVETKKEIEDMDKDEIKSLLESALAPIADRFDALEGKVADLHTFSESVKAALPDAAAAADEKSAFEAGVKAHEAGLSEAAIKRVVSAGGDYDALIESEKAIRAEYLSEAAGAGQYGVPASGAGDFDPTVGRWAK